VEATYFGSPAEFRRWLARHHASARELLVGFHKVGSGTPSMTWPESVDEALCVGWIDGVRRRVDDQRYTIRFTPRRPGSIWSAVNIARVAVLEEAGRMKAAGRKAFSSRAEGKSRIYAYEQASAELSAAYAKIIRRNKAAWAFLQSRAPWYRKKVSYWVMSAKQEATRERRLARLIELSAAGREI
jgi:uncharacterized protein YdeI (YjbR/CyaY-like superfamily)